MSSVTPVSCAGGIILARVAARFGERDSVSAAREFRALCNARVEIKLAQIKRALITTDFAKTEAPKEPATQ